MNKVVSTKIQNREKNSEKTISQLSESVYFVICCVMFIRASKKQSTRCLLMSLTGQSINVNMVDRYGIRLRYSENWISGVAGIPDILCGWIILEHDR